MTPTGTTWGAEVLSVEQRSTEMPADVLTDVVRLARSHDRDDLADSLDALVVAASDSMFRLVVCGEFKVGKSRLINALLNAAVCATDAELATAVPTFVRYGPVFTATLVSGDPSEPTRTEIGPAELARLGTYGAPGAGRALDVTIPRTLLSGGLVLIDTPGVGRGLSDAHTAATLRVLDIADGILFVSDADQEYTAPELEFLGAALRVCANAICVLTKTDRYPEWRRIREIDLGHLAQRGIDRPIVPVSAELRHAALASRDAGLDAESGFPELISRLTSDLTAGVRAQSARRAILCAQSTVSQVQAGVQTAIAVLDRPADEQLRSDLAAAERLAQQLRSSTTGWQEILADRSEELRSEIDNDLAARLLAIRRDTTERISDGVPARIWPDLEPWLYRRTNEEMIAHFELIRSRAEAIALEVLDRFGVEADDLLVSLDVGQPAGPSAHLGSNSVKRVSFVEAGMFAVRGPTIGITVVHTLGVLIGLSTLITLPVTAVLGAALGRKAWQGVRESQLRAVRAQMESAVASYLDECRISALKDSRDVLRTTERQLREYLGRQASELHRTTLVNLRTAEVGAESNREQRAARRAALQADLIRLDLLARRLTYALGASV